MLRAGVPCDIRECFLCNAKNGRHCAGRQAGVLRQISESRRNRRAGLKTKRFALTPQGFHEPNTFDRIATQTIKERAHFERLRDHLRAFSDTEITSDDYEEAAMFYNSCRAKGIQGSNTDFLICAIAVRNEFSIFTTDADFTHFSRVLPVAFYDWQK